MIFFSNAISACRMQPGHYRAISDARNSPHNSDAYFKTKISAITDASCYLSYLFSKKLCNTDIFYTLFEEFLIRIFNYNF